MRTPSRFPNSIPAVYPLKVKEGNYLHLDFQDAGGKLMDHSGRSNHCLVYGAVPVAGRNGWARNFDGVDDYILDTLGRKILREGTAGKWESVEIGKATKIVGTGTGLYLNRGDLLPPKFTGKFVSDFASYCTGLVNFSCDNNQFSGVLPSFSACTGLVNFYCYSNQFSGVLPSFSACTSLVNFYCSLNQFSGVLPSFSACTSLVTFQCSLNQFSGVLPSFSTCTSLVNFYCYSNQFSGVLPSFSTCTSLVTFYCSSNQFSGVLPSFSTCTSLVTFQCYSNQFSGYTAESFKTQKNMSACDMRYNAITNSADINLILADLRYSKENIVGRVNCDVKLEGGTNAVPTGQGLVDKDFLNANGWTVTTN